VPGVLYLVATPIGNPDDVTRRAVFVLARAHVLAAEDTRHARTLLAQAGIELGRRPLVSYYDANERSRAPWLVEQLLAGQDVAVVSDAGTPLLSDPGYHVVRAAIEAGVRVVPLPGASAPLAALVASGLPVDRFLFVGFLPRARGPRQAALEGLRSERATLVLFEAPHRVLATLDDVVAVLGDRPAAVAINVTKEGERFLRGAVTEVAAELGEEERVRGELTLVLGGAPAGADTAALDRAEEPIRALLAAGVQPRVVRDAVAELTGAPKKQVYELVLRAKSS
jgi:16S rRNA (cytidine1402-2'-O)-methyltransferase